MIHPDVTIASEVIADFCRRHRIRWLSFFGSVLRDDFRPDSDVDVLVDFGPGRAVGLDLLDMEDEPSRLFGGRRVEIVKEKDLNPRLRDRILAGAEVQYDEG
jgi:predicted nucleotidyltransferase